MAKLKPDEMLCPNCASTIRIAAKQCPHCAFKISTEAKDQARLIHSNAQTVAGVGCIGLVFLVGGCWAVLDMRDGSDPSANGAFPQPAIVAPGAAMIIDDTWTDTIRTLGGDAVDRANSKMQSAARYAARHPDCAGTVEIVGLAPTVSTSSEVQFYADCSNGARVRLSERDLDATQ